MTEFGSFDNNTCKRVLDLLKPGDLTVGQVVIKRVAVIREVSYDSSQDTHQKYTRITMSIGVRHSGEPFGITATASAH